MDASTSLANFPVSVEDICTLANSFADQAQYDKAIKLYESACKLYPDSLALKINLGRVKTLQLNSLDSPADILQPSVEKTVHNEVEKYLSEADQLFTLGNIEQSIKILEQAKLLFPNSYSPFRKLGYIFSRSGKPTLAVAEWLEARKRNPFDLETLEHLAAGAELLGEADLAMECLIDAFLLVGGVSHTDNIYVEPIKSLMKRFPEISSEHRRKLIKERTKILHQKLTESPEPFTSTIPSEVHAMEPHSNIQASQPLATKSGVTMFPALKEFLIFRNMDLSALTQISACMSEISIRSGDFVFQEGEPVYGLYFIVHGRAELRKDTPQGPISYVTYEPGSYFGDDCLLSGRKRFTSALALQDLDLLFIEKSALARLFVQDKKIAIHFLWYFWKSLSSQIREANAKMSSFFARPSQSQDSQLLIHESISKDRRTSIEVDKKLEVLQTKGLNTKELGYIARLSSEEIYNSGETIFLEGDEGDRLYVVLEGSVSITKHIPGIGHEALTSLTKGDFFGEMALAGKHLRSADAKASAPRTVLLVITKQALREILSIDHESAYQFLLILCRILGQRLFEMNEKIYQWKLMSGFHAS